MKESHVFDPKNIAALESEERKTWQNPREIIGQLDLKPTQIVADLGCGSGYFTIPISQKVKKVYGIDIQEEMLNFLKQKIQTQRISNIETLLSKEYEIPLGNSSVDLLLSINTLHEFRYKEKIINEIRRVVKPGGKVVIVDFKKESTGFGPPVSIRLSKEQARSLFAKGGLKVMKIHELKHHYLMAFQKE